MLTLENIKTLIEKCREISVTGLGNGTNATLPELEVDIVNSPNDFLGANNNPAVFVNQKTFNLLKSLHTNWIANRTIAIKDSYLQQEHMDVIGAIIHETGHAFNTAAGIANTETNAYIFEIEILLKLLQIQSPLLFNCSEPDLKKYFKRRLPLYELMVQPNAWLSDLISYIKDKFQLAETVKSQPVVRISTFEKQILFAPCVKDNKENVSKELLATCKL